MALSASAHARPEGATGCLVLADGTIIWGEGFGAVGEATGEACFNTAMTGYQEVMTDPSYAAQIVTFTFPHIGNVGANAEDIESAVDSAVGCVVRERVTPQSSFRADSSFSDWLAEQGKVGLAGVDTRALTRRIRMTGAPNGVIAHNPKGEFDIPALLERAKGWQGLEGMDLAGLVTRGDKVRWIGGPWALGEGYGKSAHPETVEGSVDQASPASTSSARATSAQAPHVVAVDYGAKDNIFRNLGESRGDG